LLINDLLNHGLHLTATFLASRDCCDTVWLPRCRLAWDLNTSSRLLLHFLNDTASSPNAQTDILVWNLFTKQKIRVILKGEAMQTKIKTTRTVICTDV
jgi:hypothetical protein